MKNITLLLVSLLFTIPLTAQQSDDEQWKEYYADKGIKSQTQWNHKYNGDKVREEGYKNLSKIFDENGNIIEEIYYRQGSVYQKMSYKYNKEGKKIQSLNWKLDDGKKKILFKQDIEYEDGKKIREVRYNGSNLTVFNYTYDKDKDNKLGKITKYNDRGKVEQNREFSYEGNKTIVKISGPNGQIEGYIENFYNSENKLTKTVDYDENHNEINRLSYKYDEQGREIEKAKYIKGDFAYKENYRYGEDGLLKEVLHEEPEDNEYKNNMYEYDQQGNLLEEQWYDNHPEKYSKKTYHYNDDGILKKVDVYYALYNYKIQYQYTYEYY